MDRGKAVYFSFRIVCPRRASSLFNTGGCVHRYSFGGGTNFESEVEPNCGEGVQDDSLLEDGLEAGRGTSTT